MRNTIYCLTKFFCYSMAHCIEWHLRIPLANVNELKYVHYVSNNLIPNTIQNDILCKFIRLMLSCKITIFTFSYKMAQILARQLFSI